MTEITMGLTNSEAQTLLTVLGEAEELGITERVQWRAIDGLNEGLRQLWDSAGKPHPVVLDATFDAEQIVAALERWVMQVFGEMPPIEKSASMWLRKRILDHMAVTGAPV